MKRVSQAARVYARLAEGQPRSNWGLGFHLDIPEPSVRRAIHALRKGGASITLSNGFYRLENVTRRGCDGGTARA